jgi:hypothetical protein
VDKRKIAEKYRLEIKALSDQQDRLYSRAVKELGLPDEPGNIAWDYLFNCNDGKSDREYMDYCWKLMCEAGGDA